MGESSGAKRFSFPLARSQPLASARKRPDCSRIDLSRPADFDDTS